MRKGGVGSRAGGILQFCQKWGTKGPNQRAVRQVNAQDLRGRKPAHCMELGIATGIQKCGNPSPTCAYSKEEMLCIPLWTWFNCASTLGRLPMLLFCQSLNTPTDQILRRKQTIRRPMSPRNLVLCDWGFLFFLFCSNLHVPRKRSVRRPVLCGRQSTRYTVPCGDSKTR